MPPRRRDRNRGFVWIHTVRVCACESFGLFFFRGWKGFDFGRRCAPRCSLPQPLALLSEGHGFSLVLDRREVDQDAHHDGEENHPGRAVRIIRPRMIDRKKQNISKRKA